MAKPFGDSLKDIREGNLSLELAGKWQDLVAAIKATGKKGELHIRLVLSELHKGGAMLITDSTKLVLPEPDRDSTTIVFATESNELSRRDPRQPDLPGVRGIVTSMPPPVERTGESNG